MPQHYQYTSISSEKEFRLLTVSPGDESSELCAELSTVDVGTSQSYEALSYTWGPSNDNGLILLGRLLLEFGDIVACAHGH